MWKVYRGYHPKCGENPPRDLARIVTRALGAFPAEDVARVIAWAHESTDKRAIFLREGDYLGLDNLLRGPQLPHRVELAAKWRPVGGPAPGAPAEVPADLPASVAADLDFLRAWLPTGTANRPPIWSQHPDRDTARRVATAVIAAGRWAPLYAALDHHLPRVAEALLRDPHHAPHHHQEAAK